MHTRRSLRRTGSLAAAALIAAGLTARLASAQPGPQPGPSPTPPADAAPPQPDDGDRDLAAQLDQLRDDVEDLQEDNEDTQEDLADIDKQLQTPVKQPIRYNLLNPPITVFADLAARADSDDVLSADGVPIDNKIYLRTAELDFRGAIDPYADGVLILALEDEAGAGFEADLEEVYVVLKRLPIVESAPLGLKLKLGRFRAPLGSTNRLHMHDMPWTTRPLPIVTMLGTEHGAFFESGYNTEGLDAELFLPSFIPGTVMELNLDVLDAGDLALAEGNGGQIPALLGHYNLFFTLGESHDVNVGLTAHYEAGDRPVALYAADLLYKWKPLARGEFHSVVIGGEAFYADRQFAIDSDDDGVPDAEASSRPFGAFAFAQAQLSWHSYLGVRYDYAQDVADDDLATQVLAAYVSYYTSEFLRFRLGYEYRRSDVPADDGISSGMFQVNYVLGSHPTEPYWVNR